MVCFGPLSCCRTPSPGWTVSFRISWQTAEFMVLFITGSLPGCEAAKQFQTITLPPPLFYCCHLVLNGCVTFTPDVMRHTPSKKLNFCLPIVLGIIKMFSRKTETRLYVLLAQQRHWHSYIDVCPSSTTYVLW